MEAFERSGYLFIDGATKEERGKLRQIADSLTLDHGIPASQVNISPRGFGRGKSYELTAHPGDNSLGNLVDVVTAMINA